VTEIKELDPDKQTEAGNTLPIGDYFASLRQTDGVFLAAHWLDATSDGESNVNASFMLGDGENATVVVQVSSGSGIVMPARMLSVSVQKSKRIGVANLRAFQSKSTP
jgi:LDH2 family malate/lactate/ureidoglycolate dehydrogenase